MSNSFELLKYVPSKKEVGADQCVGSGSRANCGAFGGMILSPPFETQTASGACPISFGKKPFKLHPGVREPPRFRHTGVALVCITHIAVVPVGQEIAAVFGLQVGSMTLPPLELLEEDELEEAAQVLLPRHVPLQVGIEKHDPNIQMPVLH